MNRLTKLGWRGAAWLLAGLVLIDRVRLLAAFGTRYVDEDQALFWFTARDLAAGHVREPAPFGQSYGTPVESWLAVPLTWLHVPPWIALPLVAMLLSVIPFLLLAWYTWRRGGETAALAILCFLLVLPTRYCALADLPHGTSAPADCAAVVGAVLLLAPGVWRVALGALLVMLSYVFYEPTIPLIVAVFTYALLTRYRERRFLIGFVVGAATGHELRQLQAAFYATRPTFNLHGRWPFTANTDHFFQTLDRLDNFFSIFTPFGGHATILIGLVAILLVLLVWARSSPAAHAVGLSFATVALMIGLPKIDDGSSSVFFSVSRPFVAIPCCIAFFIALTGLHRPPIRLPRTVVIMRSALVLIAVVAWVRSSIMLQDDARELVAMKDGNVPWYAVSQIRKECDDMKVAAHATGTSLVAIRNDRIYDYACASMYYDLDTLFPLYERRIWRLWDEDHRIRTSAILEPADAGTCEPLRNIVRRCDLLPSTDLAHVEFAPRPAIQFLRQAGFTFRSF